MTTRPPTESATVPEPLPQDVQYAAKASLLLQGMADDLAEYDPLGLNAAAYIRAAGRGDELGSLNILDDVELGFTANAVKDLYGELLKRQQDDPVACCALVLIAPLMTAVHAEMVERGEQREALTEEEQDEMIEYQVNEHRTRRRMGGDRLN